ncbi:MAG: enoyl-CoA hydratase [Candidatus Lokiarchaeota archaeon]|nr:enoyl-CoA hydratase [Candidatus Lokiarchaeota archaeon]MBD3339141.1 enoyl-CoA hydratase [Candidatus Lokiarchaeota archaeon]
MDVEDFKDILYQKENNGIVTVTLNRPERKNALAPLTLLELWYAADFAEKDKDVKVMILTGNVEANAFCSGGYFSTSDIKKEIPKELLKEINFRDMASKKLCLKYWDMSKPVIAALNGLAVGGGFTFPLICADLIYASNQAWFGLYFVKRAVMTDFATSLLLPFYVGFQKAKELFFLGDKFTAEEAQQLGLINKVLSPEGLMPYTREQALRLIPPKGPSLSIKLMKKTMHAYYRQIIETQLDLENKKWIKTLISKDFNESLKALEEKREPTFIGK